MYCFPTFSFFSLNGNKHVQIVQVKKREENIFLPQEEKISSRKDRLLQTCMFFVMQLFTSYFHGQGHYLNKSICIIGYENCWTFEAKTGQKRGKIIRCPILI